MLPIVGKRYPIGGLNVNDTFVGAAGAGSAISPLKLGGEGSVGFDFSD